MTIQEIKDCFSFDWSDEYKREVPSITVDGCKKLEEHGWSLSLHTPYYLNFLGSFGFTDDDEMEIGFCCWMSNMEFYVGGYQINITNRDILDHCIELVESHNKLKDSILVLKSK